MSTCRALVQTQPGPEKKKTSDCSLCHHGAFFGLKAITNIEVSQCLQNFALHFAMTLLLALALLCNCCHDPFIVRRAQTCPPFTGFTQLAHPSRGSRSTRLFLCSSFLLLVLLFPRGSVFTSGLQPFTRSVIGFVTFISCSGVWDAWLVEDQSCKLAMSL